MEAETHTTNNMAGHNKLALAKQMVESAQAALDGAAKLLAELDGGKSSAQVKTKDVNRSEPAPDGKVIEGVFDGQNMIGPDSKTYSVPANYASKSKLVDGDTLKLTIADDGTFVYKQIGPVERRRAIGKLIRDPETDEFVVQAGAKNYKLLRASITYFKGEEGDEIVILLPQNAESKWAAVENIIKGGTPADFVLDEHVEKQPVEVDDPLLPVTD